MRLWPSLLLAACAASCTQEDPPYGDPGAIAKQNFPGETASSSGGTGADGGTGGGNSAFPAPYNATTPAPPDKPGSTLHMEKAGFALTPTTSCLATCHGVGKAGSTVKWAYAGFAASAAGAQTGLDKGEVIVLDGAKAIGPVKTASDGYFWIPISAGTVGASSSTSIRNKDGVESAMSQKLGGNGDCLATGACHGGTGGAIDFKP